MQQWFDKRTQGYGCLHQITTYRKKETALCGRGRIQESNGQTFLQDLHDLLSLEKEMGYNNSEQSLQN